MRKAISNRLARFQCVVLFGALLVIATVVLTYLPRKTQNVRVESMLQDGRKMEADLTLRAEWPWQNPDRIAYMAITIDGKRANVPQDFYSSIEPLDSISKPLLSEWKGYPELIIRGRPGSSLNEAHWWFLNDSFAELRVEQNRVWHTTYHAEPFAAPQILKAPIISQSSELPSTTAVPSSAKSTKTYTVKVKGITK